MSGAVAGSSSFSSVLESLSQLEAGDEDQEEDGARTNLKKLEDRFVLKYN